MPLFSERKTTVSASIIVDDPERKMKIDDLEILASQSWNSNTDHIGVFVRKFKRVWDDICTLYVDMYLDKHPISKVRIAICCTYSCHSAALVVDSGFMKLFLKSF